MYLSKLLFEGDEHHGQEAQVILSDSEHAGLDDGASTQLQQYPTPKQDPDSSEPEQQSAPPEEQDDGKASTRSMRLTTGELAGEHVPGLISPLAASGMPNQDPTKDPKQRRMKVALNNLKLLKAEMVCASYCYAQMKSP